MSATLALKLKEQLAGIPSLEPLVEEITAALAEKGQEPSPVTELLDQVEDGEKAQLLEDRSHLLRLLELMGDVGLGIRLVAEPWDYARRIVRDNERYGDVRGLR